MTALLIDHIETMAPDDLRTHLRNAYGNTSALNREIEMLHRLRASMAAEIANKTRMRDEAEATTRKVVLQRDELLGVLKDVYERLVKDERYIGDPLLAQLFAAIAKAKGNAP